MFFCFAKTNLGLGVGIQYTFKSFTGNSYWNRNGVNPMSAQEFSTFKTFIELNVMYAF